MRSNPRSRVRPEGAHRYKLLQLNKATPVELGTAPLLEMVGDGCGRGWTDPLARPGGNWRWVTAFLTKVVFMAMARDVLSASRLARPPSTMGLGLPVLSGIAPNLRSRSRARSPPKLTKAEIT
jgi:hypothetical protein